MRVGIALTDSGAGCCRCSPVAGKMRRTTRVSRSRSSSLSTNRRGRCSLMLPVSRRYWMHDDLWYLPKRHAYVVLTVIGKTHAADESLLEIMPAKEVRAIIRRWCGPINEHRCTDFLPVQRRIREGHDTAMGPHADTQQPEMTDVIRDDHRSAPRGIRQLFSVTRTGHVLILCGHYIEATKPQPYR